MRRDHDPDPFYVAFVRRRADASALPRQPTPDGCSQALLRAHAYLIYA